MRARDATASSARLRMTGRAVALAAMIVLLVAAGTGVFRQFLGQRARIDRLERQVRALEGERVHLHDRILQLHDPEHLERLARRCLGMVLPGEILFVVPEEEGSERAALTIC